MNDYNIKELYEEMELHLISSMKRNLSRHLKEEEKVGFEFTQWQAEKLKELKRYQKENQKIIGDYTKGLDKNISKHLHKELKQGSIDAINQYNSTHDKKISKTLNKSFFQTNDRKVNALIKTVNNDLKSANTSALRMINDEYRQVIHKSAFFAANGVMTEKQAIDMATKDFLSRGINCIEYANGRRVNIASYSEMAIRTASLRAHLMGEGNFRKSIGRTLVKVTTHGGACKLCTEWQGKVLIDDVYSGGKPDGKHTLLSEAMKKGFLHPNCKHGLTTYYPELEGIKYDEEETDIAEELQEKINYYTRNEKRYERLSIGSLDETNIKNYKQKKIMYEKIKEDLIMIANKDVPYQDVTKEWLARATPNSHELQFDNYFMDDNGIRHPIKGKEFIHDIPKSGEEYDMALFLKRTFGGEIHLVPRITDLTNSGIKTPTPDFRWNGKKWDLKTPKNNGKFKNTIERFFKHSSAKNQAKRYIIDFSNFSESNEEIIKLADETLKNPYRQWIETLILTRNDEIIKIYLKSK